jgi:hypothetical protein
MILLCTAAEVNRNVSAGPTEQGTVILRLKCSKLPNFPALTK